MGFDGNMHFAGNRNDVPRLMRGGMNVFVFPSLWEGLPMTLIEAQAAGLPCVVSDKITDESTVSPNTCVRLPLSKQFVEWADETLARLAPNRQAVPVGAMAGSDFCVQHSASLLSTVYSTTE
jgi:hypothetical protein